MDSFLQCLGRRPRITFLHRLPVDDTRQAVTAVVDTLFIADKDGMESRLALDGITRMNDCKQNFARAVSEALRKSIETARPMVDALRAIYEKVVHILDEIGDFVEDHPILCALIALGILVLLSRWVIEALGFAEGGILEDERCP